MGLLQRGWLAAMALASRLVTRNGIVFFASQLLFEHEHWWNRWLHHHTPLAWPASNRRDGR